MRKLESSWTGSMCSQLCTSCSASHKKKKKKKGSSCDWARGQPPFPWCSCSSPVPGGWMEGQVWLDEREGDRNRVGATRQKERDICFSSRWENSQFPRSWRLGWSPPDRACWLLRGSPFVSRLPRALLDSIQSLSEWTSACIAGTHPQQAGVNAKSNKLPLISSTYSWSHFEGKLWYSYSETWLCLVMCEPHHAAVTPHDALGAPLCLSSPD